MGGPGSGAHNRKYVTRPPGTWYQHRWVPDIVTAPVDQRVMPHTVAHDEVAGHHAGCECEACTAYRAESPELLARLRRARIRSGGRPRR